jgi:hypothetical protein
MPRKLKDTLPTVPPPVPQANGVPVPGTPPTQPALPIRLDLGCCGAKRQPAPGEPPWLGVDRIAFPGVDVVCDLAEPVYTPIPDGFEWMTDVFERKIVGYKPWPFVDNSVTEVHASHFVEHLDNVQRVHFVNELYRVLIPGGKATIIVPHLASCRAYGDPTHKWSPLGEFWPYYLSREWRLGATKECPGCLGGKRVNPGLPALQVTQPCPQCGGKGQLVVGPNAPHTDQQFWKFGFNANFEAVWGYSPHPQIALRNQEAQQFAFQFYREAIQDMHCTLTKK